MHLRRPRTTRFTKQDQSRRGISPHYHEQWSMQHQQHQIRAHVHPFSLYICHLRWRSPFIIRASQRGAIQIPKEKLLHRSDKTCQRDWNWFTVADHGMSCLSLTVATRTETSRVLPLTPWNLCLPAEGKRRRKKTIYRNGSSGRAGSWDLGWVPLSHCAPATDLPCAYGVFPLRQADQAETRQKSQKISKEKILLKGA